MTTPQERALSLSRRIRLHAGDEEIAELTRLYEAAEQLVKVKAERDALKYLTERHEATIERASDPGPITVDWLKAQGFEPPYEGSSSLTCGSEHKFGVNSDGRWYLIQLDKFAAAIPAPATRSDVLTLMRLLGCGGAK